jgi:hypothetical protein
MADRYAGIDWASDKHDVLVADQDGEELLAATFAHDEKGVSALCRTLVRLDVGLVAIERPDGLLVERLLDAGLRVLALHPNKVAAARDRFRELGVKSSGNAGAGLSASDMMGAYGRAGVVGHHDGGESAPLSRRLSDSPVVQHLLCLRGTYLARSVGAPALRGRRVSEAGPLQQFGGDHGRELREIRA